jgi:hypothetical protein
LTFDDVLLSDGTIQTSSFTNNGLIEGYGTIVGTVYNEIQGDFLLLKIFICFIQSFLFDLFVCLLV